MLFKSWMNPSEFKFAMAWAYAAIHPVTIPSNIALLLWTGGGTGKSSFVAMIKEAMKMVTNAKDNEIYFEIKGNKFDEDPRNWIPDGELGVEKAALINIDEATTESINLYKNFSGSAAGNKLNIRRNYENARSVDIYGKFIFTTNQQLSFGGFPSCEFHGIFDYPAYSVQPAVVLVFVSPGHDLPHRVEMGHVSSCSFCGQRCRSGVGKEVQHLGNLSCRGGNRGGLAVDIFPVRSLLREIRPRA